ncbi:unnamed protein product [Ixodes pacificus]
MATRVFVNVDEDPFCAELVFPRGLEGGAFVSLVFGRFSRHQGSTGRKHLALQRGAAQAGLGAGNAKAPSTGDGDGVQCGTLCTSCNGWFCSVEVLQIHRALTHARSNATAKPVKTVFGCKVCRKTFPSSADCLLHKWKHSHQHGRETFLCVHCEQLFLSKAGLQRHIAR